MSCMTIKYKNTNIDVELAWYCQTDHIDIESIEIASKSQKKAKICFIGDSQTAGYYVSTPVNRFASALVV